MTATHEFGRTDLPAEQTRALRSAIRWEWFTIGYTSITIAVIALVVGNSQAMRTAWIEDMLSLIPQIAFLVALIFVRRRPDRTHPYGMHRAMGWVTSSPGSPSWPWASISRGSPSWDSSRASIRRSAPYCSSDRRSGSAG